MAAAAISREIEWESRRVLPGEKGERGRWIAGNPGVHSPCLGAARAGPNRDGGGGASLGKEGAAGEEERGGARLAVREGEGKGKAGWAGKGNGFRPS